MIFIVVKWGTTTYYCPSKKPEVIHQAKLCLTRSYSDGNKEWTISTYRNCLTLCARLTTRINFHHCHLQNLINYLQTSNSFCPLQVSQQNLPDNEAVDRCPTLLPSLSSLVVPKWKKEKLGINHKENRKLTSIHHRLKAWHSEWACSYWMEMLSPTLLTYK